MKCPECGKASMKIVKGTETPTMLECPKCGEYAYTIFGVLCIRTVHFDDPNYKGLSYEQVDKELNKLNERQV